MNSPTNQRIITTVGDIRITRWLFCLGVVLFSSVLFGYILPVVVAVADDHFSTNDFEKRIEKEFPKKFEELTKFRDQKQQLTQTVAVLETRINAIAKYSNTDIQSLEQLLGSIDEINVYVNKLKPPFRIRAFESQTITRYWVLSYFFLGTLLALNYLEKPSIIPSNTCWRLFALFLALFWIIEGAPLWIRNFSLGEYGRTFYSATNFDVSPFGFLRQECNRLLLCMLLSTICLHSLSQTIEVLSDLRNNPRDDKEIIADSTEAKRLESMFIRWQLSSLLMAIPFLYLIWFYWRAVNIGGDSRYITAAIVSQIEWGAAWVIISLPFFIRCHRWSLARTGYLSRLIKDPKANSPDLKLIEMLNPIPTSRMLLSQVFVLITFFTPLIRGIFQS